MRRACAEKLKITVQVARQPWTLQERARGLDSGSRKLNPAGPPGAHSGVLYEANVREREEARASEREREREGRRRRS